MQGSDNRKLVLKYHTVVQNAQKYATRDQNAQRWSFLYVSIVLDTLQAYVAEFNFAAADRTFYEATGNI